MARSYLLHGGSQLCHNGSDASPVLARLQQSSPARRHIMDQSQSSFMVLGCRPPLLILQDPRSNSSDRKVNREDTTFDLQPPRAGIGELQTISKNHRLFAG